MAARYFIHQLIITGILDPILHWCEPGAAFRGEGALQDDRQVHHPASEEQEYRRGAGSLQHGKGEAILLQNKNRMESMPETALSIESIETLYLLVGRKARL